MAAYLRRLEYSTNRLTQGLIYRLEDNKIIDDRGTEMRPSISASGYWAYVAKSEFDMQQRSGTKSNPTSMENQMLKIEKVLLINGQRISDFKAETLIRYIQEEEAFIVALDEVKVTSKAINKLKLRHKHNIDSLVEILDEMDDDDE